MRRLRGPLAAILQNPVLAQRMSVRARRSAEPYGWAAVADRMHCLYDSLVATNARAAGTG